jgi:acyl carrier protein
MFEKVRNTLLEYIEVDKESITESTEFLKDLKMNSYDIFTVIGQLEDEFDITIETEDLEHIVTVGDLAKYLSDNT